MNIMKHFKISALLVALIPLVALWSCGEKSSASKVTTVEGFGIGTVYQISVKGPVPQALEAKIDSVFALANASMSVFDPLSLISRLNRNETDSLDAHIAYCIETARSVSQLSGGKYDITVQPLVDAFGFGRDGQDEDADVDSLLQLVGYEKIRVEDGRLIKERPGTTIGLNSIAKGYTVDMLAEMLENEGVKEYLVNVGGEVFSRGKNARGTDWVIAIETPFEGNYVQGVYTQWYIGVSERGVATSGNYRNFHTDSRGCKFTHIIDPHTGENTESSLLSATVVAGTCALADAYGTMFIALGLRGSQEVLAARPDIAALLVYADDTGEMRIFVSDSMRPYILE